MTFYRTESVDTKPISTCFKRCRRRRHGQVLVPAPTGKAVDVAVPWADLLMLTQTDGGRQRSIDELVGLLTDTGLHPTGTVRHAIPHDLVEAVKP